MFNLFKTRCSICKMEITEEYYESFGRKFCSESCREKYRQKLLREQSKHSGSGRCH